MRVRFYQVRDLSLKSDKGATVFMAPSPLIAILPLFQPASAPPSIFRTLVCRPRFRKIAVFLGVASEREIRYRAVESLFRYLFSRHPTLSEGAVIVIVVKVKHFFQQFGREFFLNSEGTFFLDPEGRVFSLTEGTFFLNVEASFFRGVMTMRVIKYEE